MRGNKIRLWVFYVLCMGLFPIGSEAADPEVLKPRVPPTQIEEARSWKNPFPSTPENIQKGKTFFHGKAYCMTCHGKDGKGLGDIPGLVGKLPRNFTDKDWQAARMDGELLWILKNGSPGTAMVSFIPQVLSEDEAWHVILYVRSFGKE
ncbi:MAG: cytochrome c [Nitrospina sp.]|jgi:mono/diheme cytochrome c family protein|nr:cytochrome c [Nitrospina sp.]